MIRHESARKLAYDLFHVYLERGLIAPKALDDIAKIIVDTVEIDEMMQSIERKESVLKAIGGSLQ